MNEHVVLEHDGAQLAVAGVTDYSAHFFDESHRSDPHAAMKGAPVGAPRILLAHQPRSAPHAAAAGYHLQLSGHTHGGQFWPWNLFVRLSQPFTTGLNRLGKMWVYISRGTGYWGPPMRFGIPRDHPHRLASRRERPAWPHAESALAAEAPFNGSGGYRRRPAFEERSLWRRPRGVEGVSRELRASCSFMRASRTLRDRRRACPRRAAPAPKARRYGRSTSSLSWMIARIDLG